MRNRVFVLGASELRGSGLLIALALALLGQNTPGAIGLGLALALSSTALILPMAGTASPVGRAAFSMLLFEDLALVPLLFALGALAHTAPDTGWEGIAGVAIRRAMTGVRMYVWGGIVPPRR